MNSCEGVLVAWVVLLHLRSTAEAPLSKVLNPQDAQAEHLILPGTYAVEIGQF